MQAGYTTLQHPFGTDRRVTNAGGAIRLRNHKDTIMFTRQHYKTIALAMAYSMPPATSHVERQQHYADCKKLAEMLLADNQWFNTNLFMLKCGYQMEGMAP